MRFIQKIRAKFDISSLYYTLHDCECVTAERLVDGESTPEEAVETYDMLISLGVEGRQKVSQKYNIEELGLEKSLNRIDKVINFMGKRKKQVVDYYKLDQKEL